MAFTDKDGLFVVVVLCVVILFTMQNSSHREHSARPKRVVAVRKPFPRAGEAPALTNWKPKLPCNVIANAPSENWESPALQATQRRAPNWVCTKVQMLNGKRQRPRANRDENNELQEWWLKSSQKGKGSFFVSCWSSNATYKGMDGNLAPAKGKEVCSTNTEVACPSGDWLLRAGIGNRYFFVAAMISLADRMNFPFVVPTPLGAAGATLPTSFRNSTQAAWERSATDASFKECGYGRCVVPEGKLDPKWGPDHFGQGEYTAIGLSKLRPVMCDMMLAPNTLGLENAPRRDDIVLHFRSESAGKQLNAWGEIAGFGGFTFIERAIVDARTKYSGKDVVVVGMKPCFQGHPIVARLRKEYGAKLRITNYPDGSNHAVKDMQFMAMARILILSVSTYSYWAGYLSESADAIYFPVPDKYVQFNPWCDLIDGFGRRDMTRFVDSRTGDVLDSASDATQRCRELLAKTEDRTSVEVKALYGLPLADLEPGGCWR